MRGMNRPPSAAVRPESVSESALVGSADSLTCLSPPVWTPAGAGRVVRHYCSSVAYSLHSVGVWARVRTRSTAGAAGGRLPRHLPRARPLVLLLTTFGMAWLVAGCEDRTVSVVEVAQVQVMPESPRLWVGDSLGLAVILRARGGEVLPHRGVRWTSQDPSIATVGPDGLVRALSAGVTPVRAWVGSIEGTALVTVDTEPRLELEVEAVSFESRVGTTSPLRKEVELTSGGGRQLTGLAVEVVHEAGDRSGWLEASVSRTSTPSVLEVTVSPGGLEPGLHRAEVVLAHGERAELLRSLAVELLVREEPHFLLASPSALAFQTDEDACSPPPVAVRVSEASGRQVSGLEATVEMGSGSSGWLTASLDGQGTPTDLTVTVDPVGLSAGGYAGVVFVVGAGAENSPLRIPVRFDVGEPAPRIGLSPLTVGVTAPERGVLGPLSPLQVRNEGGRRLTDLSVEVVGPGESSVEWLVAALESTEAPTTVRLVVDQGNLVPGTYEAEVRVQAPAASNSPQAASVRLTLVPAASTERSTLTVEPELLPADGASTALVEIQLNDLRGDPIIQGDDRVTVRLEGRGSLSAVQDHGRGRHTAILTAPNEPGTARVTGRVNGKTLSQDALVEFEALPPPPQLFVTEVILTTPPSVAPHPHLRMAMRVEGEEGEGVEGVRLSARLHNLTTGQQWEYSDETDREGWVHFRLSRHPDGCYQIEVTEISFDDHEWDGVTPSHEYCKN